ncbi:hypothetical protein GCM10023331_13720 [Algivirga pacifica]|uniref:Lipocalin-like domain-containing protein n=1 Tax=Algivirga pacifica TaxID=1162670 RepID=A0ABP9DA08_9BACT
MILILLCITTTPLLSDDRIVRNPSSIPLSLCDNLNGLWVLQGKYKNSIFYSDTLSRSFSSTGDTIYSEVK